jgi:hypothetical protein
MSNDDDDFRDILNDVARHFRGKPNRKMSKGHELRYGKNGSLSIDLRKGVWFDHETGEGGGTLDFVKREKKLATHAEAAALLKAEDILRSKRYSYDSRNDSDDEPRKTSKLNGKGEHGSDERKKYCGDRHPALGKPAKIYNYIDEHGKLLFQVCRFQDPRKDFRQRQPAGEPGTWYWDRQNIRLVLYRLPEVLAAVKQGRRIHVVEGEKAADKLWEEGLAATCSPGGAGSWTLDSYSEYLRDADVVVTGDNDPQAVNDKTGELRFHPDGRPVLPGQDHMHHVAAKLHGTAARVRVLDLGKAWAGCPSKGDTYDYLQDHTAEEFVALADAAPDYDAKLDPPPTEAKARADEATVTPIDLWGHLNPPELPRGLLPKVIEQFALVQGGLMGVDPGGLAVAALVVCAAAITDDIELQVKKHDRGWTESARLWAALVGMPSTKKTPTMREAVRPLAKIDAAYAREYASAKQRYDALPQDQRRLVTKPVRRQLKLEDTSIEAAQEVLRDNPSGVLCMADELSGWFGSMDKYNSGRGAAKDRGFWLQAWNGGTYSVNRVTRDCYLIQNLSVSVLGGIQPDLIRKMIDEAHDDGLIQRLLPIVVRAGTEGQDTPAHDVVEAYAHLIESLHKLQPTFATGWDNPSGLADKLEFDDDAQAIRRRLEKKHLELMGLEVINKKLVAHVGKYDSFFTRLCVVFHCIEHVSANEPAQASMFASEHPRERPQLKNLPCTITAATAERAARFLHEFLLRHAAAFYAGVLDLSDDHDRLAAVAGYILAHKLERVTNRDVARGDRTMRRLKRRDTEEVFEQLGALGWLFPEPAPRPTDPRHWRVNPEVHRLFAERAGREAARRAEVRNLLTRLVG